jgi:lipopolysaccharide biosynthesis glycosyltransferase
MPNRKLAILYLCDSNYHELTLYSLASIAQAHSAPLDLHMMQIGYSRLVPARMQSFIAGRGHQLIAGPVSFPDEIAHMAQQYRVLHSDGYHSYLSNTALYKSCAIEALAKDYDYILYVDGDVLVFDDLHMEKFAGFDEQYAAVFDLSFAADFGDPATLERCRVHNVSPEYFNSGVILVNAAKWRSIGALSHYLENLVRHSVECPYFVDPCDIPDQCALNMSAGGDWRRLPVTWNLQATAVHTQAWAKATIRHYTGPRKFLAWRPWTCDRLQYALLRTISHETGLPRVRGIYDFGLSYQLNAMRRAKRVAQLEHTILALDRKTDALADG